MVKSLDFQDFRNLKDKANDARITLPKYLVFLIHNKYQDVHWVSILLTLLI